MDTLELLNQDLDSGVTIPKKFLTKDSRFINYDSEILVGLAQQMRQVRELSYCLLPLDHSLEADLLGAHLIHDLHQGSRVSRTIELENYECRNIENLLQTHPRFLETQIAIEKLLHQGEKVVVNLVGPFTILEMLFGFANVNRLIRQSMLHAQIVQNVQELIISMAESWFELGVTLISYADPTGDLQIIGAQHFQKTCGLWNQQIIGKLKRIIASRSGILHIHPMLSHSYAMINQLESVRVHSFSGDFSQKIMATEFQGKIISRMTVNEIHQIHIHSNQSERRTHSGQ